MNQRTVLIIVGVCAATLIGTLIISVFFAGSEDAPGAAAIAISGGAVALAELKRRQAAKILTDTSIEAEQGRADANELKDTFDNQADSIASDVANTTLHDLIDEENRGDA